MSSTSRFFRYNWIIIAAVLGSLGAAYFALQEPKPSPAIIGSGRVAEKPELKLREFRLSVISAAGAAIAFLMGLGQYLRAERWKRTEFLATVMKEFFSDPYIRNALTMIDYAPRRLNLFQDRELARDKYPLIERSTQIAALIPHTAKKSFTAEEEEIRDAYDRLLDQFEIFWAYLDSNLIAQRDLSPYLKYWIEDIASLTSNRDDAAWTCALFDYVDFYDFKGVQKLFSAFDEDILPNSQRYRTLKSLKGVTEMLNGLKDITDKIAPPGTIS